MLYAIIEVAETIEISKQSIYKTIMVKDLYGYTTNKQDISYINE